MSFGKIIFCLLLGGAMGYAGYLIDLPQTLYIGTGVMIFIIAFNTGKK
jgi:hypothetical protein